MKDKDKYFVETENLAFPEIHTGKVKQILTKSRTLICAAHFVSL